MTSRKLRYALALLPLALIITMLGVIAPGASAQGPITVTIVNQPTDALEGETITSVPLNPSPSGGRFVRVRVTEGESGVGGVQVSFVLAEGTGLADGFLFVDPRTTDETGVATFGPETLWIGDANEPQFTDYRLVPFVVDPAPTVGLSIASETTGQSSNGFDIFEEGCRGTGCSVAIRNGLDVYTTTQNVRLTASVLSDSFYPGLSCRNQTLIFTEDVFVHETTGSGVVGLVSHVTFGDLTGGGGEVAIATDDPDDDDGPSIRWCVGTRTRTPWVRNGARFTRQDTNGDGMLDLFVGLAPRCPANNPRSFAPCIVRRVSDGEGGFFLRGWLPGGDPPRRT